MILIAVTGKWKPGCIFSPALLFFLLLFLRFVTPRFHPSNWLVRANETGLFAQCRSYLNYQLPRGSVPTCGNTPESPTHAAGKDDGGWA
jgi:hypothetical protein